MSHAPRAIFGPCPWRHGKRSMQTLRRVCEGKAQLSLPYIENLWYTPLQWLKNEYLYPILNRGVRECISYWAKVLCFGDSNKITTVVTSNAENFLCAVVPLTPTMMFQDLITDCCLHTVIVKIIVISMWMSKKYRILNVSRTQGDFRTMPLTAWQKIHANFEAGVRREGPIIPSIYWKFMIYTTSMA